MLLMDQDIETEAVTEPSIPTIGASPSGSFWY